MDVAIERSRLDGSDRKVLFNFNGLNLHSLSVDSLGNRLYWAILDPSKKRNHFTMESSDLNGDSRRTVFKGMDHLPRGITLDENNFYWINSRTKGLWTMPKDASESPIEVIKYDHNDLPTRIMTADDRSRICPNSQEQNPLMVDLTESMLRQSRPISYDSETDDIIDLISY